ncbi:MAG: hypothetical protein JW929_16140 [Anaerolineales bacterium]|nr:hypothetical protein [Anaerolineales bacterium]
MLNAASSPRMENSRNTFLVVGLLAVLAVVLVRTAWVCDDAYITMRTVDHFTHGNGLVYNIGERVQSYTHPLWLLLLAGLYAVTGDAYFSLNFLSIALAFLGAAIFLKIWRKPRPGWCWAPRRSSFPRPSSIIPVRVWKIPCSI